MLLSASNLTLSIRGRSILRGVSLDLAEGEIVALVGPNGSGKSTLLRSILGQLPVTGQIGWSSRPLAQWNRRDLARHVAYLAQNPSWEPGQSVEELLRLGRSPYTGAFGLESAQDISVVTGIARMLNLDELLTRPIDELSGGQRQRVFLGRCLVQQPTALLLDEPDAHLDLRYQAELAELLRDLSRTEKLGILLVSHDLNLAALIADRLVLLCEGKTAATGKPVDVLQESTLEQVYGVPIVATEATAGLRFVTAKIPPRPQSS